MDLFWFPSYDRTTMSFYCKVILYIPSMYCKCRLLVITNERLGLPVDVLHEPIDHVHVQLYSWVDMPSWPSFRPRSIRKARHEARTPVCRPRASEARDVWNYATRRTYLEVRRKFAEPRRLLSLSRLFSFLIFDRSTSFIAYLPRLRWLSSVARSESRS